VLDDKTFLDIARGLCNPGRELPSEIAAYAADTADMRQNLSILYGIAYGTGAQNVLEIGTSDGTSTLALLKAVSETGGHLTSIDIVDVPVARALVDKFGLSKHWTFVQGDSQVVLSQLLAQRREYDCILVDAGHSRAEATADFTQSSKMLRRGGVMFTHDNWMVAIDHDFSKPFGSRGTAGCGFLGLELLTGQDWVGVVFAFNCNLGVFRRRSECVGEISASIAESRKLGLLP
jgi:hypothetical protein